MSCGCFRCLCAPGKWCPENVKRPSCRLELKASLWWCFWSFTGVRRIAGLSSCCCCSCIREKLTSAASSSGTSMGWFASPLESFEGSFHHSPCFLTPSRRGVDARPGDNRKSYYSPEGGVAMRITGRADHFLKLTFDSYSLLFVYASKCILI